MYLNQATDLNDYDYVLPQSMYNRPKNRHSYRLMVHSISVLGIKELFPQAYQTFLSLGLD